MLTLITVTIAAALVARPSVARACRAGEPGCVVVSVSTPPSPGNPGPAASGVPSPKADPCAQYTGYYYVLCREPSVPQFTCQALYERYQASLPVAQLNGLLVANGCPQVPVSAPPSPATLAQRAAASFRLPLPSGHRSPSESLRYRGFAFAWVNQWVFFWTDPTTWRSLSATARAGGVWARVTARPVRLSFDPGDGSRPVFCAGPGHPWVQPDGVAAPRDGCGYRYANVTDRAVTSTQTITWQLTWVGSGNTAGTLTSRSTSTSGRLRVMQIQVVTTR